MSRSRNKPRQPTRGPNPPQPGIKQPTPVVLADRPEAVIKAIEERYIAEGQPELPVAADAFEVTEVTSVHLIGAWKKMLGMQAELATKGERLAAEDTRLRKESGQITALREDARLDRLAAEELAKSLSDQEQRIAPKELSLLEREESIGEREAAAEGGFLQQRRSSLQAFYAEKEKLLAEIGELQADLFRQQEDVPRIVKKKLDELSTQNAAELAEQRQRVDDARKEVEREAEQNQAERGRLRQEMRTLAAREMNIQEDEALAVARVEAKAGALLEQERLRADQLRRRLSATSERLKATEQSLDDMMRSSDRFSGRSPAEVLSELELLQAEKRRLEIALANTLSGESVLRLRQLEVEHQTWEDERTQLFQESQQLREMLERARISVGEMEVGRDVVRSLEARTEAYRLAIAEQRSDWEQLVENGRAELPFPECSRMDGDSDLQTPPSRLSEPADLKTLAEEVRNQMAAPTGSDARYYSISDVRIFLAGLAMSRLHLLEGISGTGKTSLPLSFASAIGAGKAVIEVQAGWRDRDDLLGHFNAFEGKFYEKEMTHALYRSQCPAYARVPFFIVLDEMNLSHPEQYFADFLSELEQAEAGRRVSLRTERMTHTPRLLEEGRFLRLPPNVWFVGTANHDETTESFADKTYDRAHVMELPHQHKDFEAKGHRSAHPIKYDALLGLFETAAREHAPVAKQVNVYLNVDVGSVLRERFAVGWGNRLVNQVKAFVPVVLAAGGDIGEATDHLLSTKLLRKVRDRHDVLDEDFEALQRAIEGTWRTLGSQASPPTKSLAIIAHELRRLGMMRR